MANRLMPEPVNLGQMFNGPMASAMRWRDKTDRFPNPDGLSTVMGMLLPEWQRPFVWTDAQCISFIESAWRGVPLGSYTINLRLGSRFDGYLIDGQQRMRAIERYLDNEFTAFGFRWEQVTDTDRRVWRMLVKFNCYETRSDDGEYLRDYYNLMNFGGTAHTEDQRA